MPLREVATLMFRFPKPMFQPGEPVLVRSRMLAYQAIVEAQHGNDVTVSMAPDGNRSDVNEDRSSWERRTVDAKILRRYQW